LGIPLVNMLCLLVVRRRERERGGEEVRAGRARELVEEGASKEEKERGSARI
jgi:hypothetical protein